MKKLTAIFLLITGFTNTSFSQTDATKDTIPDPRIFEKVEVEASYPGGEQAWRSFLERNLNANAPVDNGAPSGMYTVWVQFIVDKNGAVSEITPLTKMGYGMENEVMRIMKKAGNWQPATQNGRTVKAYRKQPVTFIVEDDGINVTTKEQYVLFKNSDNEVSISVNKVKTEYLSITVTHATAKKTSDGNFVIQIGNISTNERVLMNIYNEKKNKLLSSMSFEVRDPVKN
jgi:hypothetical protein